MSEEMVFHSLKIFHVEDSELKTMICKDSPMMVRSTVYSKGGHSMRNIVNLKMMMMMITLQ